MRYSKSFFIKIMILMIIHDYYLTIIDEKKLNKFSSCVISAGFTILTRGPPLKNVRS